MQGTAEGTPFSARRDESDVGSCKRGVRATIPGAARVSR